MHHIRSIECYLITDALRKRFCQFCHACLYSLCHIQRIGTGKLIDGYPRRRLSFQSRNHVVLLTTQLNTSHILQSKNPSTIFHPKDDFAKLSGSSQAPLYIQGILKSIVTRTTKRLAYITGRHFHILCLNSRIHLLGADITDTHGFRIQPNAHGVIAGSHDIDRPYPRHTRQLVYQIQVGIVRQIKTIVNAVSCKRQHHYDV